MGYQSGVRQHANMAEGAGTMPGETFGCESHDHRNGPMMGSIDDMTRGHTKDGGGRGAGKPVSVGRNKHPAQAAPDHGPHGKVGKMV